MRYLRVSSLFLFLTGLGWAQESPPNLLRLRPPFSGLNLNADRSNIANNEFSVFSNAAVNGNGEIYKRGGISTFPFNAAASRIDLALPASADLPRNIGSLYRYYKSGDGLRRLLATTFSRPSSGTPPSGDSTGFSHWYWLNDTTSRWAYTYGAGTAPDTLSQLHYQRGRVRIRQDADENSEFLMGDSATFFLNCSNLSDLQIQGPEGATPWSVYVANDTLLAFVEDSFSVTGPDTILTPRRFEVRYRTAQSQSGLPNQPTFYTNAMTYLDTAYFSRSMFDPVGWDGSQTHRANVLDYFTADTIRDSTIVKLGKSWTANQWAGYWIFKRDASHREASGAAIWRTNWAKIKGNTATTLIIDSTAVLLDVSTAKKIAIVTMPIDDPMGTFLNLGTQSGNIITLDPPGGHPLQSYRQRKQIFSSPWQILVLDGISSGQLIQIRKTAADVITLVRGSYGINAFDRLQFLRSRFPIAKIVLPFKERTLWISDTTFQNSIYPSKPGQPGWVEPNTQVVVNPNDGEFIQSAWASKDAVFVTKASKLYALLVKSIESAGKEFEFWQVEQISNSVGCESPKSVVQRGNDAWFFDWPQGFYELSQNGLIKISEDIRPMVDSIKSSGIDRIWGVYYPSQKGDLILWGVPLTAQPTISRIIAYSPSTKAWSTWRLPHSSPVNFTTALVAEGPGDNGHLFLGLQDSAYVLRYNPNSNHDTLFGLGGDQQVVIPTLIVESKRFELPGVDMRFTDGTFLFNGGSSGTVNLDFYKNLSSTSLQTLVLTMASGDNKIKKSLSDGLVGYQLAWKLTTVTAASFRLGGVDITVLPWGVRSPE